MNRLWVRFSLIISGFFLILLLLPLGTIFVLEQFNIVTITNDDPGEDAEENGLTSQGLPQWLVGITAVVATIGIGLGVWLSHGLTSPISELASAAKQIGAGDLNQRVPVTSHSLELIELAESFNEMAEELQNAETLRSNLLADVSHELRTPLTALSGQLHAGLDHVYQLDEEAIANLYGQTQYLIRLVEDLHLLAQAEARQLPLNQVDVDLFALWQEIEAHFQILAEEKQITFRLTKQNDLAHIFADPIRLRQIFTNLLTNALRHTSAKGQINVSLHQDQNDIIAKLSDNGEGISAEDLPHLFDRFYRADASRSRDTGGSGLGLAIVKALVEEQSGTIEAQSTGTGQGTTFILTFPVAESEYSIS